MPPKQKNSKKKARRSETHKHIIVDPTLRKFDVLDFVADKLGRQLIVQKRCAQENLAAADQFEFSASFSGIPYSIIGCKGVGPNYQIAEDNAAYNFITFFENYSLPDECLPNIRRHWIRAEADIDSLVAVCDALIEELQKTEYSTVDWSSAEDHFTPSTHKLYAKELKTIVKIRLETKKTGQSSLKRKCVFPASSLVNVAREEPDTKRAKVSETPEVILSDDDDIICIDDSTDDDPVIHVKSDAALNDVKNNIITSGGITGSVPCSSNFGNNISPKVANGVSCIASLPKDYEYHLIGVEYAGDPQLDKEIRAYVAKYTAAAEKLSADIMKHHQSNRQDERVLAWKMKARGILLEGIQTAFPLQTLQMYAVGSTVNGCGSYNSDMDLCLCVPDEGTLDVFNDARNIALKYLKKVVNIIYKHKGLRQVVAKAKLISAKVPIIKVDMRAPYSELDLDINVNNVPGIYNSHLIHYYSRLDTRFPALALLVKHWAISNGISDALNGTFNSYSLILLLIHYLQCGVRPAILPNLQFLLPQRFSDKLKFNHLGLYEEIEGIPERPLNPVSVGELLIGFFHYYARFDFQSWAISVRNARKFPRRELPTETSHFAMYIEEPFDGKNTARCVREMDVIYRVLRKASHHFKKDKPELKAIKVTV